MTFGHPVDDIHFGLFIFVSLQQFGNVWNNLEDDNICKIHGSESEWNSLLELCCGRQHHCLSFNSIKPAMK